MKQYQRMIFMLRQFLRDSLTSPGSTKSLDGLRALAILLVLITHICQRIPGLSFVYWNTEWATPLYNGWIGVDLFFALSGYLVGSAVIKGINDGSFSTLTFFLRRFFRIIPAYLFVIFIIICMKKFLPTFYNSMNPDVDTKDIFANLALLTDYIPTYIGLPSWSLSIEEHFYILLPFFLTFVRKPETRIYTTLILIFSALVFRMLTYRAYSIGDEAQIKEVLKLIYFPFHNRMDALAIGILIALINTSMPDIRVHRFISSFLGLLLVGFIYASGALKGGFFNTTIQYTLVCLGFGGLLWGVLGTDDKNGKIQHFLSAPLWIPIARISYSLYLTHILAIEIMNHFFIFKGWMFFFLLGVCFLAALPLYLLIEYPFHQFAKKRFSTNKDQTSGELSSAYA